VAAADPGRVPAGSRLGAFVGIAAYEAAGDTVTRSLFSGDEDGFMDDAALVRRLAIEKLEAKAEELRPHWAWAKPMLDPDYGFTAEYARLRPRPAEFPSAIAGGIQTIEERLAKLEELPDNAWTDALASEAEDLQARHDELIETTEAAPVYAEEDRARAGVIGFHGRGYRRARTDPRAGGLRGVRQRTEILIGVCRSPNPVPAS
jgi:ParB family transcriptional regulator, chromosome partitioning protein